MSMKFEDAHPAEAAVIRKFMDARWESDMGLRQGMLEEADKILANPVSPWWPAIAVFGSLIGRYTLAALLNAKADDDE